MAEDTGPMGADPGGEGFDDGWDVEARLVDGRWVERTPRRPDREEPLRREVRLLPWLAPQLPVAVPRPAVVAENPLVVRHELIAGTAWDGHGAGVARAVADAVRSLHRVSATDARRVGVPDLAPDWYDDFAGVVLPLVDDDLRQRGGWLLDRVAAYPRSSVVHGDLGPAHLLVRDGRLAGIIDWGDCGIGDPALDLAWLLHGAPTATAEVVSRGYGVKRGLRARVLDWHALTPWHQVLHGLRREDEPEWRAGLAAVEERLRLVPNEPPSPSRWVPPLGLEPRLRRF
jgi:aminoglycoside phosphotransferase (APT) family kinase protein